MMEHPSGNGNGHSNGNGNGHGNGNGNGHAASQAGIYIPQFRDRFSTLEITKPRLFPTKREVIQKTGIARNLFFFILILVASLGTLAVPRESVTDSKALVVPAGRVDFSSPRDGFVQHVFFKEGDFVKPGDLILRVISPEDKVLLAEGVLEMKALRKEISAERDEAKFLSLKFEEMKGLLEMGSVKPDAVEEARLRLISKEKRIEAHQSRLTLARTQLKGLRDKMRLGEIRAPFQGRLISEAGIREKAFVKSGDFLFTLASEDSLVEVLIKESDYSRIEIGAKARIKFYAFPDRDYEGWVSSFKHFAEPLPKSGITRHAVKVLVRLNSIPGRIQNGMSAKVTLEAKSQSLLRRYSHELF